MPVEVIVAIIGGLSGLLGVLVGVGVQLFVFHRQQRLEEKRLDLERLKMLYASVPLLGQGDLPDAETPDVFDREYQAYLQVIDAEQERVTKQVYGLEKLPAQQRLGRLAEEHMRWARGLWSSNKVADGYRCAYHYRLAGYCFAKAARPYEAGWHYHYAGHKFRLLGELERAAECYILSAEQFQQSMADDAWALAQRAAKRAIACWEQVYEHQKAKAVAERFEINE